MKSRSIHILVAAAMTVGLTGFAASAEKFDMGKQEYLNKCAVCHGKSGKGDGGVAEVLKHAPTDLTVLSKNNGGVFPVDRIYRVIDGRDLIKSHGDRDMPVWGRAYLAERVPAAEYYVDAPYNMEMYARSRIMALIDYLNRVQSK